MNNIIQKELNLAKEKMIEEVCYNGKPIAKLKSNKMLIILMSIL